MDFSSKFDMIELELLEHLYEEDVHHGKIIQAEVIVFCKVVIEFPHIFIKSLLSSGNHGNRRVLSLHLQSIINHKFSNIHPPIAIKSNSHVNCSSLLGVMRIQGVVLGEVVITNEPADAPALK